MAEGVAKEANNDVEAITSRSETRFCDPCSSDNANKTAEQFCVQCKQYLCGDCILYHAKFTVTKTHTFVDNHELAQNEAIYNDGATEDVDFNHCELHPGHYVERFCKDHTVLCCDVCAREEHNLCKSEDIATASKEYAASDGFQNVVQTLNSLRKRISVLLNKMNPKAFSAVETFSRESTTQLKDVAKDILFAYINDIAKDLEKRLKHTIDKSYAELIDMLSYIQQILVSMDSKTDLDEELFILATRQGSKLKRIAKSLSDCDEKLPTAWIINVNNNEPTSLLTFLSLKPTTTKRLSVNQVGDIDCVITDVHCLLDGRYVLADSSNKSLKLFKRNNEFQAKHDLKGKPLNIVEVEHGRIAVTLPEEKVVEIFLVEDQFTKESTIEIGEKPTGLAPFEQKIFLSFKTHIRLVDKTNRFVERISKDEKGEALFTGISCIMINEKRGIFYCIDDGYLHSRPVVSIRQQKGNHRIDLRINDKATFKPDMALDDDNSLYVCTPDYIIHLTPELVVLQRFSYDQFIVMKAEPKTENTASVFTGFGSPRKGFSFAQARPFGFDSSTSTPSGSQNSSECEIVRFPKYCIGFHKTLGRLYIGGESNVLNIIQIG